MAEVQYELIEFTDGDLRLNVRVDVKGGTVWLAKTQIAALFEVSRPNVAIHIQKILEDRELEGSVCKYFLHTAADGKRCQTTFYNLDMILAVGYRVRSKKATEFHDNLARPCRVAICFFQR